MNNKRDGNSFTDYIVKKLTRNTIAHQTVLREIPCNFNSLYKGILNGISILRSRDVSSYPISLCIESTAKCNLRCPMCPRTDLFTRGVGDMDYDLYKKIVDDVRPVFIVLAQFGESLLHPKIVDMVKYARDRKIVTRITTNATMLDAEFSRKFIESRLSHLLISFDGCTKEVFEKIRIGADFNKVVNNVKQLIKLKKEMNAFYPMIAFNVTLSKDNIHQITDMISFCNEKFGIVPNFTKMYTYGEERRKDNSVDSVELKHIKKAYYYAKEQGLDNVCKNMVTIYNDIVYPLSGDRPCFFPYYSVSVMWDGRVYPCCIYFDGQLVLGDLSKQSFRQVWNGDKYRQFRTQLIKNRNAMPLCKSCSLVDLGINNAVSRYKPIAYLANKMSKYRFAYINRPEAIEGDWGG